MLHEFLFRNSEIILVNVVSHGRFRKNGDSCVTQTSLLHCEMSDLLISFLCVAKSTLELLSFLLPCFYGRTVIDPQVFNE